MTVYCATVTTVMLRFMVVTADLSNTQRLRNYHVAGRLTNTCTQLHKNHQEIEFHGIHKICTPLRISSLLVFPQDEKNNCDTTSTQLTFLAPGPKHCDTFSLSHRTAQTQSGVFNISVVRNHHQLARLSH